MKLPAMRFMCGLVLALASASGPAIAQAIDAACVKCHKELTTNKVVHEPMKDGCVKCHSTLDASVTPHKNTGAFAKGLAAERSALCYSCHDKARAAHEKKVRHRTLRNCAKCHDAHSSKYAQLLTEDPSTLCFSCHERGDFDAKVKHEPAADGSCTSCHEAHASDEPNLLSEPATKVCLDCHKKVLKRPHAITGFASKGHPIGGEKPGLMDPARPDQPFYCGSCHDPHKSDNARLIRFDQRSPMGFCQKCHKI